MSSSPSPDDTTEIYAPKKWKAGTLTYTTGGIVVLFCWLLLGDFSWSMRDRSVAPMSQWYLNHLMVPSLVFALLVSSLPGIIQLVVSPLISTMSDRHRGRLGRRIPFLLIVTPVAALGMVGLGCTPFIARWVHRLCNSEATGAWLHRTLDGFPFGAWLLSMLANEVVVSVACFAVFWTAFEVAAIASKPIFDGLINDVVPRPLLGRFYGLFRAISLIDGMVFNFWIIGYVPTHFTVIIIAVGLFYGIAFMCVCFRVKEGQYPPPEKIVSRTGTLGFVSEVRHYCRECFSHPYYLAVFLLITTSVICFNPMNVFAIPYANHVGVSMDTYGKAVSLTFLISLLMAYPLGWLADRFHPMRLVIVVLSGYALVTIWGSLFAVSAHTYLIGWVLHGVFSGAYYTSAASLALRLFPHEKFAQYASAAAIFVAVGNMAMAPVVGMVIDATGHNYRYAFIVGFSLTLVALVNAIIVYAAFKRYGGPNNYAAPDFEASKK
ncbi:MFS transporter [Ruficoccus sp. ZRK36]|uniref:MFS transporter n=1 Tax=Ruficoccus sp. ZRK36 TaxID=2866311 RepID=UPI001C72A4B2|nr:MFS transporter [Ruficoccus sp. ZRK36]QYY37274.1 MFS transporter [Ruficoccus sp. ZRK36]